MIGKQEEIVAQLLASCNFDPASNAFVLAALPPVLKEVQDFMDTHSNDPILCTRVVCILITSIGCSYLAAFDRRPTEGALAAQWMIRELRAGLLDTLMNPGRGNFVKGGEKEND